MKRALLPAFVLRVGPDATPEAIDAAYHELVKRFPPDDAPEEFAVVRSAYEVLRERRDRVDSHLFELPDEGALRELAKWSRKTKPMPRLGMDELQTLIGEALDE